MSILAILLAAQAVPQIRSERIAEKHFRLSISGGEIGDIEAAQKALLPTAGRLCGKEPANFGTFRYAQPDKLDGASAGAKARPGLAFEQELLCGLPRPTLNPIALPPAEWKPSEADQQAVLAATYAYFSAKDRGRHSDAWSKLSNSMKQKSPAAEWQRKAADFNARAGAVRGRRVTEITWYANPPEAPRSGIYVAADYSADFERLDFVCGYVMWLLQPDGSFRLTREEQNVFDKGTGKKIASIDRQPLRAQMGCKD